MEHAADPDRLEADLVVQAAAQGGIDLHGDAVSKVSSEVTSAHPEIPWSDIAGTRVILAHAYFHIDPAVVRQLVSADVPQLRQQPDAVVVGVADG